MSKPREHAKKILDWEDLERAPNTHGAFSFLKSAAEIVSIRRGEARSETGKNGRDSPPLDKTATVVAATTVVSKPAKGTRPYKVHRCTLAQHGQSLGETALYLALWSNGAQETPATRVITAGWRTMHDLSNMTDKNCKRNTGSLIEKLALEEIGSENVNTRTGRTYRVYSFSAILARRKAAGMEWAVWDKGRRFVQRDGSPLNSKEEPADKIATVAAESTVVKTTPVTVVKPVPGSVVKTAPVLIGTLLGKETKKTSSSTETEVSQITDALTAQVTLADERAALQLISACRSSCPDASAKEIMDLICEKGILIRAKDRVRNPLGLLLRSVEAVFDGEGIRSYRRRQAAADAHAERRAMEAKSKQQEEKGWMMAERERLMRHIQDPETSPEKRDAAQKLLVQVQSVLERSEGEADALV